MMALGFPGGSDSKEFACNAGDPDSIPGSERSPGEGNGNPLQYLAWRIPRPEKPGRLQSMGSQSQTRLSDEDTHTHTHTHTPHDGYACQEFRSRLCGSGSGFLWFCHQYSGWRINFQDDWLPWCWLLAGTLSSSLFGLLHGLLEWKGAWLPRVNNFKYRQQSESILWPSLLSHTLQFLYCPIGNQVSCILFGRILYKGVNSHMRGLLDWFIGWLQMAKGSFLCTVSRFLVWATKFPLLWSLYSEEGRS